MQPLRRSAKAVAALKGALWVSMLLSSSSGVMAQNPWSSVMYGTDGTLLGARGRETGAAPIRLDFEESRKGATLLAVTRYGRGDDDVTIRRNYGTPGMLGVEYATGAQTISLTAHQTSASGELLIVYELPYEEAFSVWADSKGEIRSGDIRELMEALRKPGAVPDLVRRYVEDRRPLRAHLPGVGEEVLLGPERRACEGDRLDFCAAECAWECAHAICEMCRAVCHVGLRIACGP